MGRKNGGGIKEMGREKVRWRERRKGHYMVTRSIENKWF